MSPNMAKRVNTKRLPTRKDEEALYAEGYVSIAGIDEVGRGSLAGPVVAAAVVLPTNLSLDHFELELIRDSKTLTPVSRIRADKILRSVALGIGIGEVSSEYIDEMGIVPATQQAMAIALNALPEQPDHLLVDAMDLKWYGVPCKSIIKGDLHCTVIAAASILAKVYRDELMTRMDTLYPGYDFRRNKGYGSTLHINSLKERGPVKIHRRSFNPLRDWLGA